MKFHGKLTIEEFLFEWFGLLGREIGSKPPYPTHRHYTDNPNELMDMMGYCEANKIPVWQSAQPFATRQVPMGLEKIFLDFDDDNKHCPECDEWYPKNDLSHIKNRSDDDKTPVCVEHGCELIVKPRKDVIAKSVIKFLRYLPKGVHPIVVETYKGYHVYIFLKKIKTFTRSKLDFYAEVYVALTDNVLLKGKKFEFLDGSCTQDISRMARVPLTIHEVSGKQCRIVKMAEKKKKITVKGKPEIVIIRELVEDKIRDVSYYRSNGLNMSVLDDAEKIVEKQRKKKAKKERERLEAKKNGMFPDNGYTFSKINRPCFQKRADIGQMPHSIRIAYLIEAYFHGANTEDKLVDLFRDFGDFVESKTRYYVRYFLNHEPDVYPPYKCETLIEKGYCVESDCPKWVREHAS